LGVGRAARPLEVRAILDSSLGVDDLEAQIADAFQ
jgi:hypothetical protein